MTYEELKAAYEAAVQPLYRSALSLKKKMMS